MSRVDLYRQARRAADLGNYAVSLGLGLAKLLGGALRPLAGPGLRRRPLARRCRAISAALLGALLVAQRPADNEHPYGHARFEAVAGSGVARALDLALALGIGLRSDHAPSGPEPGACLPAYTLAIALGRCASSRNIFIAIRAGKWRARNRFGGSPGDRLGLPARRPGKCGRGDRRGRWPGGVDLPGIGPTTPPPWSWPSRRPLGRHEPFSGETSRT